MSRRKALCIGLAGLAALAVAGTAVYAHCGRCADSTKNMLSELDKEKMTLVKAIDIAEKHAKGKAAAALVEVDHGKSEIEVYCLANDKIVLVEMDMAGKVRESRDVKFLPVEPIEDHKPGHKH